MRLYEPVNVAGWMLQYLKESPLSPFASQTPAPVASSGGEGGGLSSPVPAAAPAGGGLDLSGLMEALQQGGGGPAPQPAQRPPGNGFVWTDPQGRVIDPVTLKPI